MIIILDGPDGSGKTTLANKLQEQSGYMILHRSQPKNDAEKARMMEEYLQVIKAGQDCIFDRAWYSELVYGPAMRDASVISYPQMYKLERELTKHGAILIYCTGPIDTLWERCTSRGEDYIVDKQVFTEICTSYDELMYEVPHLIPVVTYEYKKMQ